MGKFKTIGASRISDLDKLNAIEILAFTTNAQATGTLQKCLIVVFPGKHRKSILTDNLVDIDNTDFLGCFLSQVNSQISLHPSTHLSWITLQILLIPELWATFFVSLGSFQSCQFSAFCFVTGIFNLVFLFCILVYLYVCLIGSV